MQLVDVLKKLREIEQTNESVKDAIDSAKRMNGENNLTEAQRLYSVKLENDKGVTKNVRVKAGSEQEAKDNATMDPKFKAVSARVVDAPADDEEDDDLEESLAQGVAEGYQLDEGAVETITALAKKIPGIGKYYQMAQQYKPQLIEILKTSKSGKEVKQKMEQLAAGQSATVAESGMMKQLGGLAVGGGSILSAMWMAAMGLIDGVLELAAAGEVGGAVAVGSYLGLIPVTLLLFATMLLFKGANQSSDEKAQAFQAQRSNQGVAEAKKVEEDDVEEGNKFTGNLAKARAAGKKEADLDGDGDMEKVQESVDLTECGMMPENMGMMHNTPATITMTATAGSGSEVSSMLKDILTLAGQRSHADAYVMDGGCSMEEDGGFADATSGPNEFEAGVEQQLQQGDDMHKPHEQHAGMAKLGDNPMASEDVEELAESLWAQFKASK